jgi:hypothetical protein
VKEFIMNSNYNTIKELVIETCMNEGFFPSYERLTSLVLKNFPSSKWQKTHYSWYKSKIKRGEITVPGLDIGIEPSAPDDESDYDVQETIDASLSLERDLHSYLSNRVSEIEADLKLAEDGIEFLTDAGRIDILAVDGPGDHVVIELKAGKAKDNALGQLLGYIGCILSDSSMNVKKVRGILVASDFDQRVIYAAKALPNINLT